MIDFISKPLIIPNKIMSFRQAFAKLYNKRLQISATVQKTISNSKIHSARLRVSNVHEFGDYKWRKRHEEAFRWVFLSGQAAVFLGIHSVLSLAEEPNSENNTSLPGVVGLQRVDDGSVISNEHTSKWRVFTDNGRGYFLQGNIEQAEKFFISALQEAKEGFGERDPHVASACNNLAELYRVRRAFDDAEPLYVEAINILEDYFGTDDVRVGAALHNLGQFYLAQRKLEKAHACYERALKIKRRVLGESHPEYADTMYHLGTVLYLQGNMKDCTDLIADSIRILEAVGQGESVKCMRRMQYLVQIYNKSNRFADAEILLRKIFHIMELSKGWKSLDTVLAAERLALTIQKVGRLNEAEELFERCLQTRKKLLPAAHIQIAANMLHIARVKIDIANQLMRTKSSQAMTELDLAKILLHDSTRICRQILDQSVKQKGNKQSIGVSRRSGKEGHSAALILLQSLNSLGSLEIRKLESANSEEEHDITEADAVLRLCISTFKEFEPEKTVSDSPEMKGEYLSCLRRYHDFISNGRTRASAKVNDIEHEIRHVEVELEKNSKP